MDTRIFAVRKRLSALWNVEPYRIEVRIGPSFNTMKVELDGKAPTSEQMQVFEKDIQESTALARSKMN